jgi:hypothetical protein
VDNCPLASVGKDPTGNNTWYYVHTLAVFYIEEVLVQGSNVDECAGPPGGPPVPVTNGGGNAFQRNRVLIKRLYSGGLVKIICDDL